MGHQSVPKTLIDVLSFLVTSLFLLVTIASAPAQTPSAPVGPVFLPAVGYDSGGSHATSVAVADINRDNRPDVLVANISGPIGVLLGRGDGTFKSAALYPSGGLSPLSVIAADVNGDNKLDLLALNGGGSVSVLLGNGDGTFQTAATYNSGGFSPVSFAVGDFNGDGTLDVAVAHSYGADKLCCQSPALGVLLGNGNGTFQPAVMYGRGGQTSVSVGDVNSDHRLDLVVTSLADNGVDIFLGNGDGIFQSPVIYDTGSPFPYSVAVADLNGDGQLDIVVDHGVTSAALDSPVGVLLGNGGGTFKAARAYDSGVHAAVSVAVSDVNLDGKPDLLLAGNSGLGVLLGNGDGTFEPALAYGSGGSLATSVVVADLNGDRKPDLIAGNIFGINNSDGAVGVLLNNTPVCVAPPAISISATPKSLWPPNGQMRPVTVSGRITDSGCVIPAAAYSVMDEYGLVQPSGRISLGADGSYSFTVWLQASRLGRDVDGRLYTLTVGATNNVGKMASKASTVTVPHDQGH
jgi:hypothetical protein